jgi:hypothetical protein
MPRLAPPPAPPVPSPFRAERMSGPDGAGEWWGDPLTEANAIARLQSGGDVVVRGPSWRGNRNEAMRLALLAFGGHEEDPPHQGPLALPPFHPPGRSPEVHVFFDRFPAPYARRRKPPKRKRGKK